MRLTVELGSGFFPPGKGRSVLAKRFEEVTCKFTFPVLFAPKVTRSISLHFACLLFDSEKDKLLPQKKEEKYLLTARMKNIDT